MAHRKQQQRQKAYRMAQRDKSKNRIHFGSRGFYDVTCLSMLGHKWIDHKPKAEGKSRIFRCLCDKYNERTHTHRLKKSTCRQNFRGIYFSFFFFEKNPEWNLDSNDMLMKSSSALRLSAKFMIIVSYRIVSYILLRNVHVLNYICISLFKFPKLNTDLQRYVLSKWLCSVFVTVC